MDNNKENENELLHEIREIKIAILGKKDLKIKGILDYIHEHEERIEAIEEFKKRITWQSVAIAGFAVFLAELVIKLKGFL